jgi:hypothetical protein
MNLSELINKFSNLKWELLFVHYYKNTQIIIATAVLKNFVKKIFNLSNSLLQLLVEN